MIQLTDAWTSSSPVSVLAAPAVPALLRTAIGAVDEQQWSAVPFPAPGDAYSRLVLVDTPELLVIAARWPAGGKCELHGHGDSAGFYRVVAGALEEERYLPRGGALAFDAEMLDAGDESFLPAGSFHQLRAIEESVSVHAYSPRPEEATSAPGVVELRAMDEARRAAAGASATSLRTIARRRDVRSPSMQGVVEKLAERWREYEQEAIRAGGYRVPPRVLDEMRSSGLLVGPLPRLAGGLGATLADAAHSVAYLAERAPAAALALVMPLGNVATCRIPLSAAPREHAAALRRSQRWIAEQATRGRILAVANSEPGANGDLSQTQTAAVDDGDTVRLTGRKTFATIGPDADYFLVAARTKTTGGNRTERVDGYFVHRDAPGLTVGDRWAPFGMRPTASVALTLEDVPAECLLGYPGCLEGVNARHWSTLLFSAVFLGIGRASLREGVQHAAGSAWGRAKLAEHSLALDAAAGFLHSACVTEAWPMAAEQLRGVQRAKTFVTQTVVGVATQVAMLAGGRSYHAEHPVYRLLADALAGPLLRPPLGNAMDAIIDRLDA